MKNFAMKLVVFYHHVPMGIYHFEPNRYLLGNYASLIDSGKHTRHWNGVIGTHRQLQNPSNL
jgi:hypothetical protein